jgi:hypothetical protein
LAAKSILTQLKILFQYKQRFVAIIEVSQIISHHLPNYSAALAARLVVFLVTSLKLEKFIH